jgi:hypothetical protein
VISYYKKYNSLVRKKGTGPRSSLTEDDKTFLIDNSLREAGLFSRSPAKVPLLTAAHKSARLAFAEKISPWPLMRVRRIISSDECRFEVFGSDGQQKIRRAVNT